jgi:hypothetical protein
MTRDDRATRDGISPLLLVKSKSIICGICSIVIRNECSNHHIICVCYIAFPIIHCRYNSERAPEITLHSSSAILVYGQAPGYHRIVSFCDGKLTEKR